MSQPREEGKASEYMLLKTRGFKIVQNYGIMGHPVC
jgi:hypothetical protein